MFHFIRCKLADLISDFVIGQLDIQTVDYYVTDNGKVVITIKRNDPKRPRVLDDLFFSLRSTMPKGMIVRIQDKYSDGYSSSSMHRGHKENDE